MAADLVLLRPVRSALTAVAFAALFAFLPAHARACGAPDIKLEGDKAATLVLAADAAVFGVTDLFFIASGRPMPMWLSIVQVTVAGFIGPSLALLAADSPGLKVASGASAVWFGVHGINDMTRYPAFRGEQVRKRELQRARQRYDIAIEPRAQGGMLHLRGKF